MCSRRYVTVPITTLWTSPTAPRDLDKSAVAVHPDVIAWLADLDAAEARLGLHGRTLTQLELGEPVDVIDDQALNDQPLDGPDVHGSGHDEGLSAPDQEAGSTAGWLKVVAPLQPTSLDPRGYPGWVPACHVDDLAPVRSPLPSRADSVDGGGGAEAFVDIARTFLGLAYLWGGMCDLALDCSGLVHLSLRRLGLVFPRDADDQFDACEHVPTAEARPGDLYFFAHEGKRPHHVGIVTGTGRMLHAPETGAHIVEEALSPTRQDSLIGVGRVPALKARKEPAE